MLDGGKPVNVSNLETRQQRLQEKLALLQEQYDLETRAEEKMRLQREIDATEAELLNIQQQSLVAEANRLKSIGSPHEALLIWQQIQSNDPENNVAAVESTALEKLAGQQDKAADLTKRLTSHIGGIRTIFKDVVAALRQPNDTNAYVALVEQTESLLAGDLDAGDYQLWWEAVSSDPVNQAIHTVDMGRIAKRVQLGEMVLFLGSGIASVYGNQGTEENEWVHELAKEINYKQFQGSLPSIAEYYQLRPDFGQTKLLKILRGYLAKGMNDVLLYLALAKVPMPLILISSAYDNRLEQSFRAAGKAFVELASIVRRSDEYDIGHVVVSYSDNSQPKKVYPEEELSGLRFIEKGYSVIYKIRGNCTEPDAENGEDEVLQQDALTLSESNYFSFARYAEKIIPGYLARQLRNRGFLFVGYQPKDWQDRLLASALLDRRHSQEPCYVIGETSEPLEAAFWKSRSIEHCAVDVRELDRCLAEVV